MRSFFGDSTYDKTYFITCCVFFCSILFFGMHPTYAEETPRREFETTSKISISKIETDEENKQIRVIFNLPGTTPLKDGWLKLVYSPNKNAVKYDGTNWVWYSNFPTKSAVYQVDTKKWKTPGVTGNTTDGNPAYEYIWKDSIKGYFQICLVTDYKMLCGEKPYAEADITKVLPIKKSEILPVSSSTNTNISSGNVSYINASSADTSSQVITTGSPVDDSATQTKVRTVNISKSVSTSANESETSKTGGINQESSQLQITANVARGEDTLNFTGTLGFLFQIVIGLFLVFIAWWSFQGFGRMLAGMRGKQVAPLSKSEDAHRQSKLHEAESIPQHTGNAFSSDSLEQGRYPNTQVLRIYRVGNEYRIEFDQLYDTGVKVPEENRRKILQEIQLYIHALQKLTKARGIKEDLAAVQIESYSLEKYGSMLYRLLFSEKIRRAIETSHGPLVIRTDDHEIPWELLHTGKSFIALDRPMGREILFTTNARVNPISRSGNKLRMLCISNPTGDLLGSEQEVVQLYAKFGGRIEMTVLSGRDTSVSDIFSQISRNDWDIIHYAGHANFRQNSPDESGLLLADGQVVSVSEIRRTLGGNPLVFLNACMTGRNVSTSDASGELDIVGLSSAFISGGALGVIAPLWAINDSMAARFSIEFYNALFSNKTVGEAILQAKKELNQIDESGVNWSSFSYYGNPSVHIGNNLH